MSALTPLLSKVFQGPLDLNGPVLGRVFFLFEYARMYVEEWIEAFDARFGTDTSAPVFEREHMFQQPLRSFTRFLRHLPWFQTSSRSSIWDQVRAAHSSSRPNFRFAKIVGIELSEQLHRIAENNVQLYKPASQQCDAFDLRRMDVLDYDHDGGPLVLFSSTHSGERYSRRWLRRSMHR